MNVNTLTLNSPLFPDQIKNIPTPPAIIHIAGDSFHDLLARPRVAIVGSRKVSTYGTAVIHQLVNDLVRAGIVIISGLAIGADTVAHRAALEAGGQTIAVLPSAINTIYPATNHNLAQRIVREGGALVSEYAAGSTAYKHHFIARNRIVSALSDVVVVAEATSKSGTLHTARFALEQGRDVMAIPGNITMPTSYGTNHLIKSGAGLVTSAQDVLLALGISGNARQQPRGDTPEQQCILDLIYAGESNGEILLHKSGLDIRRFDQSLTMLEITGKIRGLGANTWGLI
jgi:DNA processing protein